MGDYILGVGQKGSERLQRLDDILGPYSRRFLLDAGLAQGIKVIEFGCGTGNMTKWIAEQIGPAGSIVAVDSSEEQVNIARDRCAKLGKNRIEFIVSSAEALVLPDDSFDLAYARLFLMHLREPKQILKKMHEILRSKGILITEEPNAKSLFTYSSGTIFERINEVLLKMGEKLGLDFEIGDKLFGFHRELSRQIIKSHFIMPVIPIPDAKEFIGIAAKEGLKTAINLKVISRNEADSLLNELLSLPDNPCGYYGWTRHAQVASIKSLSHEGINRGDNFES
ncbi:MAG: class I SAM-dependent methyltransferase [bacterium]